MINHKIGSEIYKRFLSLILLIIIYPTFATELKGTPEELKRFLHPNKNTISLHATAKLTAYSDKAIVQLTITTEKKQLATALEENAKIRRDISQTLVKNGIKAVNIHTSQFSSSPQFGWFGQSPKSYQVVNRMSINIYDEDQLTEIAKLSDANQAIEINSTQFEHTKKDAFYKR
ncbi:MAG: SIMPL domain-containing protein [Enterobacterales bacterium]|nr:SIMPL domain-containing protein [Enterobacterales bacterium]